MSGRRRRDKKQFQYPHAFPPPAICKNCGEPGPHFVPPSFGYPGFFMCLPTEALPIPSTETPTQESK